MDAIRKNILENIRIVLVDTDDSANIGSVCRAMKTMGINDLFIVSKKNYDEKIIKYIALHAYDIYEKASFHNNLEDALSDTVISFAATRRRGKKRKYSHFSTEYMIKRISEIRNGRIAIVFGNEEHGLEDSQLKICSAAVSIPTSEKYPSLNLSHAVQIITFLLFSSFSEEGQSENTGHEILDNRELNKVSENIAESLSGIGFFKISDDSDIRIFLKDIFARASINRAEGEKIIKLFRKITGIKKTNFE